MQAVTDRDRWLALGLLLAVLVFAYLLLVHPWWTQPMRDTQASIEALQERSVRARAQLQQAPEVAARLRDALAIERRVSVFLPEASAELAFAGLAQRLETEVERASPGNAGCAINNRTPMDQPRAETRFEPVTVHVRLRCGNAETAALLHALEGGSPRLFVDNLSVVAQGFFERPGGAGGEEGGLDVEFDLHGYLAPASLRGATGDADAP